MSDTTPTPSVHEWFRARIAPQAFGLLDDAEDARFLGHARECPECDEAMKVFARDNREELRGAGHVPARILARWDRARIRLRGMARHAVRAHLESCEACRQDLALLGHTPALEVIPELESDDDETALAVPVAPVAAVAPVALPARPLRIVQNAVPTSGTRRRWMGGGALAGALATAAVFLVVFRFTGDATRETVLPTPGPAPPPVVAPPPAAPAGGSVLDVLSPPLALSSRTRSSADSPPALALDAGARFLQLALPDLFLPEGATVRLMLVGPDGAEIQRLDRPASALARGNALLFGNAARPLASGVYWLHVTPVGAEGPPIATFEFRLDLSSR